MIRAKDTSRPVAGIYSSHQPAPASSVVLRNRGIRSTRPEKFSFPPRGRRVRPPDKLISDYKVRQVSAGNQLSEKIYNDGEILIISASFLFESRGDKGRAGQVGQKVIIAFDNICGKLETDCSKSLALTSAPQQREAGFN